MVEFYRHLGRKHAVRRMEQIIFVEDGLTGRVCPSDWDKRKTPFASPCLQATYEGRRKP